MTNNDIRGREDVILLVNRFYDKVRPDDLIGYIFNDIAKVDWEKHLPVMYDFWEGVIFYTGSYAGNPMITHRKLNQTVPLTAAHFERWLKLFSATLDENFAGEKTELARQRAISIATVMRLKLA